MARVIQDTPDDPIDYIINILQDIHKKQSKQLENSYVSFIVSFEEYSINDLSKFFNYLSISFRTVISHPDHHLVIQLDQKRRVTSLY